MWTKIFKSKSPNNEVQSSDNSYYNTNNYERRYSFDSPTIYHFEHSTAAPENIDEDEESVVVSSELKPCPICNRKFNPTTYEKHVGICSTTTSRKRKTFDSSRQRREGTDLASYLPKNFGLPAAKVAEKPMSPKPAQIVYPMKKEVISSPTVSNFSRSKSVRASKRNQPPPSEQCPHCERFFGTKAYDRHVEWCKEKAIQQAIKNPESNNAAKDRLYARTKYRAPCLKSKRTVTREKYSPSGFGDDDERMSQKSTPASLSSSYIDGSFLDRYDPFISAKRQLEELCSPTLSTKSFFESSTTSPIQKTTPSPKVVLDASKSNFRRTLSLRSPRKASLLPSRPVFLPTHNYRPTVQRGISDEGPISTNFLKPEEYDEMPVRSVCQNDFAITNTPRPTRRDSSASSRRDSSASSRRGLRLDIQKDRVLSPNLDKVTTPSENDKIPTPNQNINKTDSLSVFLKYEQESKAKAFDSPQTVKDLKDKSNALSKQNSSKELSSEKPSTPLHSVRLEPIDRKLTTDFIDPKLINICDNLPITVTKLSESDVTSDSSTQSVKQSGIRNSADGKNLRKRRMLFDRNQFLFDATPDVESLSLSSVDSADKILDSPATPQLDDFDVEEFLSSFGSDEKDLPLFKGCQDFLSKHMNNNNNNNKLVDSNDCPLIDSASEKDSIINAKEEEFQEKEQEKGEIFICIETDQSENDFEHPAKDNPLADNPTTHVLDDISDNKFSKIEDEDDKVRRNNEKNLKETDSYHSAHEDVSNNNVQEKRSTDSAYGSLSRQSLSTISPLTSGRVSLRTRPATAAHPEMMLFQNKYLTRDEPASKPYPTTKLFSRDSSSGGSETSFPPINLSRQELEMSASSRKTTPSPTMGKLSKFCHECGNKFIVETAKFCMECGVKRIVL